MRPYPRSELFKKGSTKEFFFSSPPTINCGCGGFTGLFEKGVVQASRNRYKVLYSQWSKAKNAGMTHKIWQSSISRTPRPTHDNAVGQTVPIDADFIVGGEQMFLPSDPSATIGNTANCKCRVKYIAKTGPKRNNPTKTSVKIELTKFAAKHNIPLRALLALISAESDWQQFDVNGQPNITDASVYSSAGGLGQVTQATANRYNEDYYRLLIDWVYNLEVSVKIYAAGYHHPWNRSVSDLRIRAARAYGMYHDGFVPGHPNQDRYKNKPRGLTGTAWEIRYLSRY